MLGWKRTLSLPLRRTFRSAAARGLRDRISPEPVRYCGWQCPQCGGGRRDGNASATTTPVPSAFGERAWPEMAVIA